MKLLTFTIINNDKAKSTWTHLYSGSKYLSTNDDSSYLTGFTIPSTANEIMMFVGEYIMERGNGISSYNMLSPVIPMSIYNNIRFFATIDLTSTNWVHATINLSSLSKLEIANVSIGTGSIKGITVHLWYR